jgi:hypothetical protein
MLTNHSVRKKFSMPLVSLSLLGAVACSESASKDPTDSKESSTKSEAGAAASGHGSDTFRIDQLLLRDPHLYLGTADLTDKSSLGVSINETLIPGGLTMDYDNDGFVDVSVVVHVDGNRLHMLDAHCRPATANQCQRHPAPRLDVEWTTENVESGECLKLPSNSSYEPPIALPSTPCSRTTEGRDVEMTLGGVQISMTDAKIAFRRSGQKLGGLIVGFVTQAKAEQATLPSYVPVLAGSPLSRYLHESDRDNSQSPNGEDGYWFYTNFAAAAATYSD